MKPSTRRAAHLVFAITLVTAGVAYADHLVLHTGDSLTVDGTTYACDDPTTSGVNVAAGDKLTIGKIDLRCKTREGAPPPPPPAPLSVSSAVDANCLTFVNQVAAGRPTGAEAARWADACRPFEIGKQCTITQQTSDPNCVSLIGQIASSLGDRDVARVAQSCQMQAADCPSPPPTAVESHVDLNCISQLNQVASQRPDVKGVASWASQCRSAPVAATCTVVGGATDMNCVSFLNQLVASRPTAAEVPTLARACRTLQLACP